MGALFSFSSYGNGEFSKLEVGEFLLGSDGFDLGFVLGESGSERLGVLNSKILWSVLLVFPDLLGIISSLLVQDGEALGDVLSDNL